MIVQGSINYTTSGRKRKATKKVKKASPVFKPLTVHTTPYRRETREYPSQPMVGVAGKVDESYKKEVSQSYTLAPAYNKGAYQVISKENIKHIFWDILNAFKI